MSIPNCPKCGYGRVSTNKIEIIPDEKAAGGVHVARHFGHPAFAAGIAAVWGVTQVVNAFREDWKCDHCDHRFSVA